MSIVYIDPGPYDAIHDNRLAAARERADAAQTSLDELEVRTQQLEEAQKKIEELKKRESERVAKAVSEAEAKLRRLAADAVDSVKRAAEEKQQELERELVKAAEKFAEEKVKRRALHNRVMELQGNIRVFCRVRPILKHEIESGDAQQVISFPRNEDRKMLTIRDDRRGLTTPFEFDHVFAPEASQ